MTVSVRSAEPAHARQFQQALPGYKFVFPRDHASHDEYKTEWWYFTGHLQSQDHHKFGYELTFFRTGLDVPDDGKTPWKLKNMYLAHFAVTDENGHKFFFREKMNRAGLGTADAMQDRAYVFNENWSMELLGDQLVIRADTPEYTIHLLLNSAKPPAVHGHDGVSQKASCKGCASHYYSLARLQSKGTVVVGNTPYTVSGVSWMDHEFGSNELSEKQVGWDWYSIQLDNNHELMLYMLRNSDGTIDANSSGSVIYPDGQVKHLGLSDFSIKPSGNWTSTKTKAKYPMGWHISVPSIGTELDVKQDMEDQELVTVSTGVTYWEGASSVSGTFTHKNVEGQAYVELTGYAGKLHI
jgi:predicted secreted hydrolase